MSRILAKQPVHLREAVGVVLGMVVGATSAPAHSAERSAETRPAESESSGEPPDEGRAEPKEPQAAWDGRLPVPEPSGLDSLGSVSVGHPHAGFQLNAVRMPKGPGWTLSVPDHAWGTEETVYDLVRVIQHVRERIPRTPPVVIGSISAQRGGHLPPHKSHRTGRDVDVYFYRKPGAKWYKPATADDLDRARTWALLRAVVTMTDVDFVLIDQRVQNWLEDYALSIGEDPAWIKDLFHGSGRYKYDLVKHIPGHVAHMHIRFASPLARKRGVRAYDRLVAQGHIDPPSREVHHRVAAGDTLLGIARHYGTTVDAIRELNGLEGDKILVGQTLTLAEREDLRGARDPVVVPPRRLPKHPRVDEVQLRAALLEVEEQLKELE